MKVIAILMAAFGMMVVLAGCEKPAEPQYNNTAQGPVSLPPDYYEEDLYPPPPPPPPTPTPQPSGSTVNTSGSTSGTWNYTVQRGDWLFKISRDQYGTDTRVKDIKALNPEIANWDQLKPGQVLRMPAK